MSHHTQHELDALYQQRKSQQSVPSRIKKQLLRENTSSNKVFPKLSVVLTLSGVVSFSIFAIIANLAKEPTNTLVQMNVQHTSITIEEPLTTPKEPNKTNILQLPPKPDAKNQHSIPQKVKPNNLGLNDSNSAITPKITHYSPVEVPQFKQPQINYVLTKKVLPKYPVLAAQKKIQGKVKLSYHITEQGRVTDIEVIEAIPKKVFNQSARKALMAWQYKVPTYTKNESETVENIVEFSFTLAEQ